MKTAVVLASAVIVGLALVAGGARAQVTPQTVDVAKVNVQKLAAGYRASKVVGSSVVNDTDETIGKSMISWSVPTVSSPLRCFRSAVSWASELIW